MRALTYFVATSLDGFIAAPDGDFSAFPTSGDHVDWIAREYPDTLPVPALEALDVVADNRRFDTVLMGWNTYAVGQLVSPYPHLDQRVFSRTHEAVTDQVTVTGEDPVAVTRRLKERDGAGIWLCGGAQLAASLVDEIDQLVLKVNPFALGDGIPLFAGAPHPPGSFTLSDSRAFRSGVVVNQYRRAT